MLKQLITAALLLIPTISTAAQFSTVVGYETGRTYIVLQGDITNGDAWQLQQYAFQNPSATHVAFNSPGGLANEGYRLGNMMSQLGLKSYVGYGHACISACYTAFLGGHDYEIKGALAAHVAWYPHDDLPEGVTVSDILKQGQALGTWDMYYHVSHGFKLELPYFIMNNTSKDMFAVFTHEDQLNQFYARSDEDKFHDYVNYTNTPIKLVHAKDLYKEALINLDKDYPDQFDPRY